MVSRVGQGVSVGSFSPFDGVKVSIGGALLFVCLAAVAISAHIHLFSLIYLI